MANDTEYGLAAILYTGDRGARASASASRLVAGTVWVNCFFVRDLRAPFGGRESPGSAARAGIWSFDFYADVKNVCTAPWQPRALRAEGDRHMGEIVGAGLVAHVPTIMLPEDVRLEITTGRRSASFPA